MNNNDTLYYVPNLKKWCVDERRQVNGKRQGPRSYFNSNEEAGRYLRLLENEKPSNITDSFNWKMKKLVEEHLKDQQTRFDIGEVGDSVLLKARFVCNNFLNLTVDCMPVYNLKVSYVSAPMMQNDIMQQLVINRSRKTVKEHLSYLKTMFSFAITNGCRISNPLESIKVKLTRESNLQTKKLKKIDPYVIKAILNELDDPWYLMTKFAAQTGLRSGEQQVLTWGDVDLDNNTVHVSKGLKGKLLANRHIGKPKNDFSIRRVYLDHDPVLVKELKELYLSQGRPAPDKYVFPTKFGDFQKLRRKRERLQAACLKAGFEKITWHDLRHYYASILIARMPTDLKTISELLGHSSSRVTEEVYGHWIDDPQKEMSIRDKLRKMGSAL